MNKNLTIFLTIIFLLLFTQSSFTQQRERESVKLNMISERLYEILEGRGANGGFFIGDNGILIIDAKMDKASVDETINEIKKITDKPIKYLVNTHSDGDHIRGNTYFPSNITVIAHENCRKEFFHPKRNNEPSDWNDPGLAPFIPSMTFRDKMDIYLGSKKVELWYFGIGHTTGDAVVYFPEEKTAFIGDLVFLTRPQLIHSYKGGNSFEYVKTVSRILETLDAEKFFSGHSESIDRQSFEKHMNDMKNRQEKIKTLIEKNKTLDDIKSEFDENESRLIETIYNEIQNSK